MANCFFATVLSRAIPLRLTGFALVATLLLPPSVFGSDPDRQQRLFSDVETALNKGDYRSYQKHRVELNDYPLAPYLDYLYLSGNLSKLNQSDINRFVSKHADLPQAERLRKKWLLHLASSKQWQAYLSAYRSSDGAQYQCLKGIALEKVGKKRQAWQEAKSLWLQGNSQHSACDPLFANWKAAGGMTQSLILTRFWLAARQGNLSLARYLDRSLNNAAYKASTKRFWAVDKKPQLVATSKFNGKLEHHRTIMLHGINKLISKNFDLAVDSWLRLRERYPFSEQERSGIDQRIALRAAKNDMAKSEEIVAAIDPDFKYPKVTEWRIRMALAEQDWEQVLILIARLPGEFREHSRWRYWNEVATLKFQEESYLLAGKPLPKKAADLLKTPTLQALSQERNFYAFLVADLKGKPFQLNNKPGTVNQKDLQKLQQEFPGLQRISEWLDHKRYYQAQMELNRITPQLNDAQKQLIPYLAQQWGWYHQAIMAAARATLWDDLELRFPTPDAKLFSQFARKNQLDYPWVLAIARQESAFHPIARSHSGAMGLMQLMPATAKQAARQAGIPFRRKDVLFQPKVNIALGTTHLSWLSKRFSGSRVLATAAYNAGSTPVKRWMEARGDLPLDIWIETIPYDETRNYVQSVMAFRVIYGLLENQPVRMFSAREVAALSVNRPDSAVVAQRLQARKN